MSFIDNLAKITEAKWYRVMMPKLYGWGAALVILGALLVQGIRTGDTLFTQQSSIVYTFIFGLLLATIMMLPLGLLMGRYAYKSIIKVPREILIPIIIFLTIIGSYSIQNNILNGFRD